jgi:cytoskeletal protein RodZ
MVDGLLGGGVVMLEIGDSLREARIRREVALSEVEKATHIRVQQLEALEREQFDLLPPDPYRRSFLCEYAEFLGLDGDLYTAEYTRRFPEPGPAVAPPPHRRQSGRLPSRRSLISIAVVVAVVLVGVLVTVLGRSGGNGVLTPPPATCLPVLGFSRPCSFFK